jgi:hypothetical protein
MSQKFTHEQLRKSAVRWLTVTKRCSVILSELVSSAMEIPDAVGWKNGFSFLVECKASRSDFLANKHKCCIRSGRGVGNHRFFLCAEDVITTLDLEGEDWGLLWVCESGRIKLIKEAVHREPDHRGEITMLVSALRRMKTREFITLNILKEDEKEQDHE